MSTVVTLVLKPAPDRRAEFDSLLAELKRSLAATPPDGMAGLEILRDEEGAVLVQGRWRDRAAHRAYRAGSSGGPFYRALSECSTEPPVTYTSVVDEELSVRGLSRG